MDSKIRSGRARLTGTIALGTLSLLAAALVPGDAGATQTYSWSLDCSGNGFGSVTWDWLQDGVVIAGASGSASCSGNNDASGSAERPGGANGITATVTAAAGFDTQEQTGSKSFTEGKSFKLQVGASAAYNSHCGGHPTTGPPCIDMQGKESASFAVVA